MKIYKDKKGKILVDSEGDTLIVKGPKENKPWIEVLEVEELHQDQKFIASNFEVMNAYAGVHINL
jgi:hypothetical protein